MISIIVSKYHPTQINLLRSNIEHTIGVPFELIVIENGLGSMGLCEVYNKAAKIAEYDILCFAHEDIEMMTMNWGEKLVELFEVHKQLGLLGLAGSAYKSLSPSGWWHPYANAKTLFANYIQSDRCQDKALLQVLNQRHRQLAPVVCVDGFWFCTRKEIALRMPFDEKVFQGFHCYDIDFSLSVFRYYEVAVTYEITVKHFSEGSGNRQWVHDSLKLYQKWKDRLPFDVLGLDAQTKRKEEVKALAYFLYVMLENDYSLREVFSLLWSLKVKSLLGLKGFAEINLRTGWTGMKRFFHKIPTS